MQSLLLSNVIRLLRKEGYELLELVDTKPRCFDLIARKDKKILLIKVLYNVDSLKVETAEEMRKIAKLLNATALVIGERFKFDFLERRVVYTRYDLPVINLATFYDYLQGDLPYIYSAPGGYYVKINAEKLRKAREAMGISIGDAAKRLGVSKRTVRNYEEGSDASVEVAIKIEEVFGDVVKKIDFSEFIREEEREIKSEGEEDEIVGKLREIGIAIYTVRHTPFDAISKFEDNEVIMGLKQVREIEKRAQLIGKVSEIVNANAAYVTERELKKKVSSVVFVLKEELESLSSPDDFISLINEKREKDA
ncbi:MAG: transcriptional regulator [Archaeoglobaceae archaeon]|nr:transcriptional regulator [Archaeoglobaceae archaeon]MDW8118362.1 transcriptional regulator [Archaeoglobaceae archaeon]